MENFISIFKKHTQTSENVKDNDIDLNPELAVHRMEDDTFIPAVVYKPKVQDQLRIRTLYHHVLSDPLFIRALNKIKNSPDRR